MTWTSGVDYIWDGEWRKIEPLNLDDYPVLRLIWDNDEDDEAFADQ